MWLRVIVVTMALCGVARAEKSVSERLATYLGSRAHDRAVRKDVMRWHHTMSNGCVAYASTALRHVGVAIDERAKLDGDGVSRLTRGFRRFLEEEEGWQRIEDATQLQAGDLVFTTDAPCCPGYPAHVFVFDGWVDAGRGIARVSDNTGYRKRRPLAATGGVDGFAFALRAPGLASSRAP